MAPIGTSVWLDCTLKVGQVLQVLEHVQVELLLRQRRIGLVVVGEVDQLDLDPGLLRLGPIDLPIRLRGVGDADLDRSVGAVALGRAGRAAGRDERDGEDQRSEQPRISYLSGRACLTLRERSDPCVARA
ncbi:hypothetical protein GCM10028864_67730 [Microlunatus parietis]